MFYLVCNTHGQYGQLSFTRLMTETGYLFLKEWFATHGHTHILDAEERERIQTLLDLMGELPKGWKGMGGFDIKSNDLTRDEWNNSEVLYRGAYHIEQYASEFHSIETPSSFDFEQHESTLKALYQQASLASTLAKVGVTFEAFRLKSILRDYEVQQEGTRFPYNPEQAWSCPEGVVMVHEDGFLNAAFEVTPSLLHAQFFENETIALAALPVLWRGKITLCRMGIQLREPFSKQAMSEELSDKLTLLERQAFAQKMAAIDIQQKLKLLEDLQKSHPDWFPQATPPSRL